MSIIIVIASLLLPNFAGTAAATVPVQDVTVVSTVTIQEDGSLTAFAG